MRNQILAFFNIPTNNSEAVVDPQLQVYGIQNLRVIDTSIMATTIAGYNALPAYMIGEKSADIIKNTWIKKGIKM